MIPRYHPIITTFPDDTLHIVEGVVGYWHYHLAPAGTNSQGLCGARTMFTSIPLGDWGMEGGEHLPKHYTYCKKCDEIGVAKVPPASRKSLD